MRKSGKRVFMMVVCVIMLFALSTCAYAKKPSKAKVRKAYKTYLTKVTANGTRVFNIHYIDINHDGIQDLFFERPDGADTAMEVCTYKKGKVKAAGTLTGKTFRYSTKVKSLCAIFSGGGGTITKIYKLSGSKLKMIVKYQAVSFMSSYSKNDKSISWAQYDRETQKYSKWKVLGGVAY